MALSIIQLVPLVTLASDPHSIRVSGMDELVCRADSISARSRPAELIRVHAGVSAIRAISSGLRVVPAFQAPAAREREPGATTWGMSRGGAATWHSFGPPVRIGRVFPIDPGDGTVPSPGVTSLLMLASVGVFRRRR